MATFDPPRLIADIGGTFARFALVSEPGRFDQVRSLRCADHEDFHAALRAYLSQVECGPVRHAAIAIANPVSGDAVRMTNYHWQFSIEEMRQRLRFDTLLVVNDFTALAMALPRLSPAERRQVGGGAPRANSVVGLLGSGSGLGVSGLIPAEQGWISLGSEGGHTSFSPRDERELAILQFAWQQHPHVSFERLLSAPGLELIHAALTDRAGLRAPPLRAPEITRLALGGEDARCAEAVDVFCAILGTAAGNLAVTLGAMGGVYIGGSIVPRLGTLFDRSRFRARFEDHGRHSAYLGEIPTYVITAEQATFAGVAAILDAQLARLPGGAPSAILDQVGRSLTDLSAAERRVAEHVLAHPRSVLGNPIAEIAKAASVSQPTVIRFCRSLGCDGLSDFKLRLASALSATLPVTHTQVTGNDSALELGAKVLSNTASAILQLRSHLNSEAIDRAVALLLAAQRVEFHAVGHSVVVAEDAQLKFLRFGISTVAYTDARVQLLAARVLRPGDVVVVISSSGKVAELLQVADIARARGASVVAITAGSSPLARKADIVLVVDSTEDVDTQMPMISRILHLLLIDILAVSVTMRRTEAGPDEPDPALDEEPPDPEKAGVPLSLARLTAHSR
ncbi:MAG: glucokinase [Rubrivivax sp.]|nr:glucokinase [Rubrivivax sp.]